MAKKPAAKSKVKPAKTDATADILEQPKTKVMSVARVGSLGKPLMIWRAKAPTGEEFDDIEADHAEDVVRIFNSRLNRGRVFTMRSLEIENLGPAPARQIDVLDEDEDETDAGTDNLPPLDVQAPPPATGGDEPKPE